LRRAGRVAILASVCRWPGRLHLRSRSLHARTHPPRRTVRIDRPGTGPGRLGLRSAGHPHRRAGPPRRTLRRQALFWLISRHGPQHWRIRPEQVGFRSGTAFGLVGTRLFVVLLRGDFHGVYGSAHPRRQTLVFITKSDHSPHRPLGDGDLLQAAFAWSASPLLGLDARTAPPRHKTRLVLAPQAGVGSRERRGDRRQHDQRLHPRRERAPSSRSWASQRCSARRPEALALRFGRSCPSLARRHRSAR
jgi:hypothetical protein